MTDNEPKTDRKLGAAGWVILWFLLAAAGGVISGLIYLLVKFAQTLDGGQ